MNTVLLTGKLTCDPEVNYTAGGLAIATLCIETERPVRADQENKMVYPKVTVYGRQAENCKRFTGKGLLIGIQGHMETRSLDRNGSERQTMELIADRIEFLEWKSRGR